MSKPLYEVVSPVGDANDAEVQKRAIAAPIAVAAAICTTAPGTATRFTCIRSSSEKCSPTPNISRMTPISARVCSASLWCTRPRADGPTRMPAAISPSADATAA